MISEIVVTFDPSNCVRTLDITGVCICCQLRVFVLSGLPVNSLCFLECQFCAFEYMYRNGEVQETSDFNYPKLL
jgi:hypothetical protein